MPVEALPLAGPMLAGAAMPGDVTTCTITFGTYADLAGTPLATLAGRLYPVDPHNGRRIRLTNTTTGHVLLPSDVPITITAGAGSVGPIPHTDNASLAPAGFAYRVEWDLPSSKPSPGNRTFLLPSAAGDTVDFDLLIDADTTVGVVIAVPAPSLPAGGVDGQVLGTVDGALAWVDQASGAAVTDATGSTKGVVQLAGDLAGTADAPTVPGLAGKASTSDPRFTDTRTPADSSVTDAKVAAGAAINADKLVDGTANKLLTAAERTKLGGVATGATANATDAQLRDRSTHTGTQAATTITGLATVATSGSYTDLANLPTLPPTPPQFISGNYFFPYSQSSTATSATLGTNTLRAVPVAFAKAFSLVRLGAEVTAAGDAGSKVRLGIYADNGSGYPGALTVDAGQIAGDSATVQELIIATGTLPAGLYWFAAAIQSVTTTQPTVRIANLYHGAIPLPLGASIPAANATATGLATSGITGALPANFPAGATAAGTAARLFIKTA